MIYFLQKGKQYKVVTPRVDSPHSVNWFEPGEIVTCTAVFPIGKSVVNRLTGDFMDKDGIEQTLSTGDVVAL